MKQAAEMAEQFMAARAHISPKAGGYNHEMDQPCKGQGRPCCLSLAH
jgi:hypothetical protein